MKNFQFIVCAYIVLIGLITIFKNLIKQKQDTEDLEYRLKLKELESIEDDF